MKGGRDGGGGGRKEGWGEEDEEERVDMLLLATSCLHDRSTNEASLLWQRGTEENGREINK